MVLALVITALILTKDIVLPVAFAAIFSVVLLPIARRIEQKTGRILSIVIVLLATLIVVGLLFWFVVSQLSRLVDILPDLENRFSLLVNEISDSIDKELSITSHEQVQIVKDGLKGVTSFAAEWLLSTSYLAYFFVQLPIYIFLFLFYRDRFKDFLLKVQPQSDLKWTSEIQTVVRSYISGLALVVFIAGVLNSIGLLILGIDNAIFFGFLSGMLTMIPYIGITIGAALPTLMALLTKDSGWYAVGVIAIHAFVQFLEGNFITPKITGSRISINALAAIFALLVGGKIWGIAGMILAVPAVGILKIVLSYSNSLKPLVILLGDEDLHEKEIKSDSTTEPKQQ